jgi:hypothetical protein
MRAPRHLMRAWGGCARGACLALVLVSQVSAQQIVSARYDGPTDRYPHGVLGDEIEYDTLVVRLRDGREISARWAEEVVFEDIAPRVVDVDSDGAPEVVAVESHETKGARLAIWGLVDGALAAKAATPFIGTRFRWLAPVAVADLDGDGLVELAYVDRPHLAKVLRVWRYDPLRAGRDRLHELAALSGVTNHRIGWAYIAGGLRDCGLGPEMVLANADWSGIVAVTFDGTTLARRMLGPYAPQALERALDC